MTKEIVKEQKVIILKSGVYLYIDKERADKIINLIEKRRFINIDGNLINTSDISGIFNIKEIEENIRRKNGQWKDKNGIWRNKGDTICPICGNVVPKGMYCGNCYGY
ncbi:MAG TPA: hypothetical protein PKV21_07700 [bacterium]|nr:hypothetical protein [bacterium]